MLLAMEHATITAVLAVFSVLGLTITLTSATLRQLSELLSAFQDVRRASQARRNGDPED